jgi:hypothetical protein
MSVFGVAQSPEEHCLQRWLDQPGPRRRRSYQRLDYRGRPTDGCAAKVGTMRLGEAPHQHCAVGQSRLRATATTTTEACERTPGCS